MYPLFDLGNSGADALSSSYPNVFSRFSVRVVESTSTPFNKSPFTAYQPTPPCSKKQRVERLMIGTQFVLRL
jgi:hypothetical protein